MTGPKAYTMREMKGIVEYLVENKAYGEIKGRKMWMDYANSSRTTRTWQSLKETFLKRILPDIQNPYYQLTRDQVCSFRQGVDVEAKERNNRLEIRPVSEESTNNEKQKDIEQPCTSAEKPNEAEKPLGEIIKSAAITERNRSSADTFIIDEDTESRNSRDYPQVSKKTTEELLEELGESTKSGECTKSLKECLAFEYSEPPYAVREVLNDFETESEDSDKEPQMKIVEDTPVNNNAGVNEEIIVVMDSENIDSVEFVDEERILVEGGMEVDIGPTFDHEIITEVTSTDLQGQNNWLEGCDHTQQEVPSENKSANSVVQQTTAEQNDDASKNGSREETEPIIAEETVPITVDDSENLKEKPKEKKKLDNENNILSSLNATSDTIIPNNQEVLNVTKSQRTSAKFDILAPLKDASRKRSTSPDQILSKKTKLDNGIESKTNGGSIEVTPPSSNDTEAIFEALKKSDKPVEEITMQDAQDIDESPQNKNPCLKSVSLFEEQFNTTKYSDSDEDTPIPNNELKIIQNTAAGEDNQSKIDSPPNDKKKKVTDPPVAEKQNETVEIDPLVEEKQKRTIETDLPVEQKQKGAVETDPPVEQKQKGTVETDPPVEQKQKETEAPDQVKQKKTAEKKHGESTKVGSPVQKKKGQIEFESNSDSDVQLMTPPAEKRKESFKNLAHAFGFVPGTSRSAAQRRRSLMSRNRTKSQRSCNNDDSDWESSISEPELADGYISPPRGRRNKHTRKYKKPSSGRIMSLNEEGGLFVVHGNHIYPLVKRGKALTYVTLNTLDDSEEERESMYLQKYIEEKKKGAILRRKLNEIQACHCRSKSPILPTPSRNNQSNTSSDKQTETNEYKQPIPKAVGDTNVQITLTKNKESLNLQGHWPELKPAAHSLIAMYCNMENVATTSRPDVPLKEDTKELTTPIITVTALDSRKVDDIESEIFKEIEEQAKNDETKVSNVTKRKAGRAKKTPSTSSEQSEKAAKRPRRSKQNELNDKAETQSDKNKMADEIVNTNTADLTQLSVDTVIAPIEEKPTTEHKVVSAKPKKQTQNKMVNKENTDNESVKVNVATPKTKERAQDKVVVKDKISKKLVKTPIGPIEPRVTRSRKSGNETDTSNRTTSSRLSRKPVVSEDQIRYMFPPEPKSRKSTSKVSPNKTKSAENPHETSQGDFRTSVDSTQGYQDSDPSPAKVNTTKRKRKTSITVRKGKYVPRRKSFPTITVLDMSFDSSNSSYFVPKKSNSQSTLDSAIYKTDSYRKHSIKNLDVIDETSKSDDLGHFNAVTKESSNNSNIVLELGSSSNVSLPLSPELSVVENLTISREMIQSDNHPTINEMQANNSVVTKIYNQYLISDVDVSIPLMQQDCELLNTHSPAKSKLKKQKSPIKVSELLSKVSVNMTLNNTLSDSLDRKLRDLLLESAQKITDFNKENLMDVDESKVVPKKTRGKKRCSTPRKRASNKQTKPTIEPVIDEHMESCSYGGRNSCPPIVTFIPDDENAINSADVQLKAKPNPKPREKKDIIKVKIQRPKNTKKGAKGPETSVAHTSQISVYTDSGINESASISEVFLEGSDSVELIHNHSETCLQVNECIGNSIEFVENSSESIISVNSTASLEKELLKVMEDVEILSGRHHSQNAQDSSGEKSSEEIFGTPTETIYHSPLASNCSLITDDLSNETPIPSTKWYLFSEDDTNNTNMRPEQMTSNARVSNFSANLKQLFPITCAVPDLSTISEMSKENEGSRKDFDTDSDTRSNSQS